MTSVPEISLEAATARDAPLLANLLELYVHDLSAIFPSVALGPDGRFGYAALPLYRADPERRFAFIIRCAGEIAGFAFATRSGPVAIDPDAMDVAEFFVLRRYRRARVGQSAATLLWICFPGRGRSGWPRGIVLPWHFGARWLPRRRVPRCRPRRT